MTRALHSRRRYLSPDRWYACDFPERPPDDLVSYDFECPACRIAASVHVRLFGDGRRRKVYRHSLKKRQMLTLSEALATRDEPATSQESDA